MASPKLILALAVVCLFSLGLVQGQPSRDRRQTSGNAQRGQNRPPISNTGGIRTQGGSDSQGQPGQNGQPDQAGKPSPTPGTPGAKDPVTNPPTSSKTSGISGTPGTSGILGSPGQSSPPSAKPTIRPENAGSNQGGNAGSNQGSNAGSNQGGNAGSNAGDRTPGDRTRTKPTQS